MYHRTGRDLFHLEPNSIISAELSQNSIEAIALDPVTVDSAPANKRILVIMIYRALRRLFRSKGYVCGSTGDRRASRFQNMCLELTPSSTVQGGVLGRCHQGFEYQLGTVQGSLALTLVPHVKLTTSFAEAIRHLPDLKTAPRTFIAFDYDPNPHRLYNSFLAPHRINGSFMEFEDSSETVVLHLGSGDAEFPLASFYLLLAPKDQNLLGLSEQFGSLQTHRYAGQVRDYLLKTLSSLSHGGNWSIELAPGNSIVFDGSFIKV